MPETINPSTSRFLNAQELSEQTGLSKYYFIRNAKKMGAINGRFNPKLVHIFLLYEGLKNMDKAGAKEQVKNEARQIIEDILQEMGVTRNG